MELTVSPLREKRNSDTLNNDISNLQIMDKKEHDRMNTRLNIHRRWYERGVMPPPWK